MRVYQPGLATDEDQDPQPLQSLAESDYQSPSPVKIHYMTGYDSTENIDEKELAEIRQQLHYTTSLKKTKPHLHLLPLSDYAEDTQDKKSEIAVENNGEGAKSVIEGIQQHKGLS